MGKVMTFLHTHGASLTAAITKVLGQQPEPIHKPFITIPDDCTWGHHVSWRNWPERTIWGHIDNTPLLSLDPKHKRRFFEVGSVIRCRMQNGRLALFRVVELRWERDPRDMFFGRVEDIGWEDEVTYAPD